MKYVVGVDLGGTNIAAGVVGEDGTVAAAAEMKTEAEKGPEDILRRMAELVTGLAEQSGKRVEAVGVGSPGPLSQEKGEIYDSPNLPGWRCVPLVREMEERTGRRCVLENDANAACLGEKLFGAGKPYDHIVHLTLGTGIGGGLILDGKLYRGANGAGAELGHMVLDPEGYRCGCGRRGCFEAFCSDSGIRTQVKEELHLHPDSRCNGVPLRDVNFRLICDFASGGDAFARTIYDRVVRYLGIGIGNLVNIFNPQAVILSGGMVKAGPEFIEAIEAAVKEEAFAVMTAGLRILPSRLGDETGLLGAAACALVN